MKYVITSYFNEQQWETDIEAGTVLGLCHWRNTDSLTVCLLFKWHQYRPDPIDWKCNVEMFCEPKILQCTFSSTWIWEEMLETGLILAHYNVECLMMDASSTQDVVTASCHFSIYTRFISLFLSLFLWGYGCCWTQHISQEESEPNAECWKREHARHYEQSSTHSIISAPLMACLCASCSAVSILYWSYIQLV